MTRLLSTTFIAFALLVTERPAGAIQQFIVFFSEGDREQLDPIQWRIGAEGDAVIAEFAAGQKKLGGTVLLTAGDQHVGTLYVSIERSRKRADAVRESLVKYGVPASVILIKPCGYARYLFETRHGVSEPMNRFVSLDLLPLEVDKAAVLASPCNL